MCAVGHHHTIYFMSGFLEGAAACSHSLWNLAATLEYAYAVVFDQIKTTPHPKKKTPNAAKCTTHATFTHKHIIRLYSNKNAWDNTLSNTIWCVSRKSHVCTLCAPWIRHDDTCVSEYTTVGAGWFVCMRRYQHPRFSLHFRDNVYAHYPKNIETSGTAFIYGCPKRKRKPWGGSYNSRMREILYLLVRWNLFMRKYALVFMRERKW